MNLLKRIFTSMFVRNNANMDTTVFLDPTLSVKAKGVMAYLLSLPQGSRGQVYDIVNNTTSGKKSVQAALKELSEKGYVRLIKERTDAGSLTSYYKFYGTSQD